MAKPMIDLGFRPTHLQRCIAGHAPKPQTLPTFEVVRDGRLEAYATFGELRNCRRSGDVSVSLSRRNPRLPGRRLALA